VTDLHEKGIVVMKDQRIPVRLQLPVLRLTNATTVVNVGCLEKTGHKSHPLRIAAFDPERTSVQCRRSHPNLRRL
jgi:hypothetical protein